MAVSGERFYIGIQEDAQMFCQDYFAWYNQEHHHTALVLLTPEQAHFREAPKVLAQRQVMLDAAYAAHPVEVAVAPMDTIPGVGLPPGKEPRRPSTA